MVTALLLSALSAFALQDTKFLHVGDPTVSASMLKPYINHFHLTLKGLDGKVTDLSDWSDQLEEVTIDGKKVWKRTQINHPIKGRESTIINVFDETTVAPISSEVSGLGTAYYRRQFKGTAVIRDSLLQPNMPPVWQTNVRGQVEHNEATLQEPVFDFAGGMFGILLRCFPLKEGFKATFPMITQFGETYQTATSEVQGKETLHTPVGDFDCYKVYTEQPAGHLTCWLAERAPYLIRVDAFGPKTGDTIFEMTGG